MLLRRFYDDTLAQASYLIGCQATGEALVVDPTRDAEQYVAAAAAEGVRVTQVTETHIHADFVSGSRELAARTGALLLLSDEGGEAWRYRFATADRARLLRGGDTVMVGNVRLDVLHTPGHTPEHLSFVVTDTPARSGPLGVLTGDFVFVGDVGRPDLLERAAGAAGTMEEAARVLHRSLDRFRALADHLQVWPGHGAGSSCGKALGAVPASTVGYEKLANWALAEHDEEGFVRRVLDGQPDPPPYFARMKRMNRDGPPRLHHLPRPERLTSDALGAAAAGAALVVDTRPAAAFGSGHLPGALSLPLNRSFATWAGWLVPGEADVYLVTPDDDGEGAAAAARALALIGADRVVGYAGPAVLDAWAVGGRALAAVAQIGVAELAARLGHGEVTVVDVRNPDEWAAGHLPGALHRPLGRVGEAAGTLPTDRPVVLQCQSGARSMIAASVLQARGMTNVASLTGGLREWEHAGYAVERG